MTMDLLFEIPNIRVVGGECVIPIRHFLLSYEKNRIG